MKIDLELLERFEQSLNPAHPEASPIPLEVLGFGEISSIFRIGADRRVAYKRMPLFRNVAAAEAYVARFREYSGLLAEAGLRLPEQGTAIVRVRSEPVVCYIAQQQLPAEGFGHRLIHRLPAERVRSLLRAVAGEIRKVFRFNQARLPVVEIALDGQLSNWVHREGAAGLVYIDTGTPLFRKEGIEQLDPELFLQSAPSFLRWIIRWLFLADVMNRYYDQRQVCLDLVANLHKEQRPDLVPAALESVNELLADPLSAAEVDRYYRQDRLIWTLFLAFRRIDRGIRTRLLRKRYEFILPGRIRR